MNKDKKIILLKDKKDIPKFLSDIFNSFNYKKRMEVLKKINQESMLVEVKNN